MVDRPSRQPYNSLLATEIYTFEQPFSHSKVLLQYPMYPNRSERSMTSMIDDNSSIDFTYIVHYFSPDDLGHDRERWLRVIIFSIRIGSRLA